MKLKKNLPLEGEKNGHFEVVTRSLAKPEEVDEEPSVSADIFTGCSSMCLTDEETAEKSLEQQIELIVQQKKSLKPSLCSPPKRHILMLLNFTGLLMLYALRVNLSVAIVSMVKGPKTSGDLADLPLLKTMTNSSSLVRSGGLNQTSTTSTLMPDLETLNSEGEFEWDEKTKALVLGSFFWGYILFQLPGGRLADSLGSKWLLGGGILFTSLLTVASPLAARLGGSAAFIACRVLEGVFEGVVIPSTHSMLAKWFPPTERSTASGVIYSGGFIGTVIALPLSALLCDTPPAMFGLFGGWPSVFYLIGIAGVVWSVLWFYLVSETPQSHPTISQAELRMLLRTCQSACRTGEKKASIPWQSIATSGPVWALAATHFGQNWGFYTLLIQMPRYFAELGFDLKSNGAYSALPYLSQAVLATSAGFLCDRLFRSGHFRLATLRKAFNSMAFAGTAACLLAITTIGRDHLLNILLLVLALSVNGLSMAGYSCTHIDLSPRYSGTLMGITNCLATFAGVFSPIAVGQIISLVVGADGGVDGDGGDGGDKVDLAERSLQAWKYVFYLAAAVYLLTGAIFVLFASNDVQEWNDPSSSSSMKNSKSSPSCEKYQKKADTNCD